MHEMGVVLTIVSTAERAAKSNNAFKVSGIVLQIGELSGVLPHFVEVCWPAAIQNSMLEEAKLVIEVIPGLGTCMACGEEYNILQHEATCPSCTAQEWDPLSGREVMIKEIAVE